MQQLLGSEGFQGPGFQAAAQREARVGLALVLAMIGVVYLMVAKPQPWG